MTVMSDKKAVYISGYCKMVNAELYLISIGDELAARLIYSVRLNRFVHEMSTETLNIARKITTLQIRP